MEEMRKVKAKCYLPADGRIREYSMNEPEVFTEITDYWGKREGVVFFPFDRNSSAYFFSNDVVKSEEQEIQLRRNEVLTKEEYETSVYMAQQMMQTGEMDKVVLARNAFIRGNFDPESAFEEAMHLYSDSYCYFINLGYEQWVGASPELLLHFEDNTLYTVALAGTKLLEENFTDKEIEEQRMVELFVEEKLHKVGLSSFHKAEKQEAVFNQIKHLKTAYTASCSPTEALEVLRHLQPTSAVCGLPRDKSFAFISDFETINRSFYAGTTGVLEKNKATFFVNLRCMRFMEEGVELFAGAGITADSVAEEEWLETERKIEAIMKMVRAH